MLILFDEVHFFLPFFLCLFPPVVSAGGVPESVLGVPSGFRQAADPPVPRFALAITSVLGTSSFTLSLVF